MYFVYYFSRVLSICGPIKLFTMSLNPQTKSYEFLGPPGALLITLLVPTVTYALYFACSEQSGGCPPKLALNAHLDVVLNAVTSKSWWFSLWDTQATLIYIVWYAFCVL